MTLSMSNIGSEPPTKHDPAQSPADPPPLLRDFLNFLATSKRWWLLPIVVALLAMALIAWLTGEPERPFAYPNF